FGRNLLWAEAEMHKRQRRALSHAFSNAAIRSLAEVFHGSANKVKMNWDALFESASTDTVVIEVQECLDSIGIGGFNHDFGTLNGAKSTIAEAFDSFGNTKSSALSAIMFILAFVFPFIFKMSNKRVQMFQAIPESIATIADELLRRARAEKEANVEEGKRDRSIIGTLIRSETASERIHLEFDEIVAQWALIELCRHPEIQNKIREEVNNLPPEGTYDLPYLDAVVRETFRLHPALSEISRKAHEDDIIPLTSPIIDANGCSTSNIIIAKGTLVCIPIMCLNTSEHLWGPDAKVFSPDRWINGDVSKQRAANIHTTNHIHTFVDGPRTCLGRDFAMKEVKTVLHVLINNFSFELPDGPATQIDNHIGITARPKVAGQEGAKVPLIVRRVAARQ
ncbi:hypothetical protein H0H92_001110, partial [Tricholoma furcatifolium]